MKTFRKIGKGTGIVGGTLVGGSIKLAGKAVGTKWEETGKWMEEVGASVKSSSEVALENAGQFVDGALQGTYGVYKKDELHKQEGMTNIKNATGRTFNGMKSALKYTGSNTKTIYQGTTRGDRQQVETGIKNLGKLGVVSYLAIGVVDLIDGADIVEAETIDTRNDSLSGYEHPETGVLFVDKTVELPNGQVVEGVFPDFDEKYNVFISEGLYNSTDAVQFEISNDTLYQAITENHDLVNELGITMRNRDYYN